ncbi:hypothetical protein B0H16DRAFT_68610 [Mycena metata]|uniref:Uncharacterized protein n=1 Tax=Mycena metata TaxID=1033252 RepID=A0AAD7IB00_9AGAR|nr:hypothetical protein B0H16DRAFT_68610 [Mycena metata]
MRFTPIRLQYPLTKPFSQKYCFLLLGFALVSVSILTTVNVFLVGYNVVSITTTNFHSPAGLRLPWDSSSPCAPHEFRLGDTFRTNISAFSYSIFDVQLPDDIGGNPMPQGSFSYAENDLSQCDVTEYEITVRPGDRLITASTAIQCKAPLAFQASTSWSFSNHEQVGAIAAGTFPENSLARAITNAMIRQRSLSGYLQRPLHTKGMFEPKTFQSSRQRASRMLAVSTFRLHHPSIRFL